MADTPAEPAKAAPPDWQLIQARYCQGVPAYQLAQEAGVTSDCVRQRARRGKWSRLRVAVRQQVVASTGLALSKERDAIAEESKRARQMLSTELLAQIGNLSTTKHSRKLERIVMRAQANRAMGETAKTIYSWDADSARRTVINVSVLEECTDIAQPVPPTIDAGPPGPTA